MDDLTMSAGMSFGVKLSENRLLAAAVALGSSIGFVAILCVFFNPVWETNDDVAMSMVAHGYGIAALGSPKIVFSNVLWGMAVRSFPSINGVFGYSLGTLAMLTASAAAIVFFLLRLRIGLAIALLTMALVMTRPVLFPQFTVVAGLLGVAFVVGLIAYDRCNCILSLSIAGLLGFFGFLIRNLEFVLIVAIASPLLPWQRLRIRRFQWALAVFGLALLGATAINIVSYDGSEWDYFRELQLARQPFTDYGGLPRILEHPDVLARHGLSKNDLTLIANWFFVDRDIANPTILNDVVRETAFLSRASASFRAGLSGLNFPFQPGAIAIALTAFGLAAITLKPRVFITAFFCIGAMFILGAIGRQGLFRVLMPTLYLLTVVSVLHLTSKRWQTFVALTLLSLGLVASVFQLSGDVRAAGLEVSNFAAHRLASKEPVVIWGSAVPYETMYPLFIREADARRVSLFGLGSLTHAPYSVANFEEQQGRSFVIRLLSPDGIAIAMNSDQLDLLTVYCRERHGATLRSTGRSDLYPAVFRQTTCSK